MKKRIILAFAVILLSILIQPSIFSFDQDDFDRIVDFSVTIKTLNQITGADTPSFLNEQKLLLLNGTVTNISFINSKKENFKVQVELVAGEWMGLEEVKSYHCLVLFEGQQYFSLFPKRIPRKPSSTIITANDNIIVVAKALKPITTEGDEGKWLLQGFYVRVIH